MGKLAWAGGAEAIRLCAARSVGSAGANGVKRFALFTPRPGASLPSRSASPAGPDGHANSKKGERFVPEASNRFRRKRSEPRRGAVTASARNAFLGPERFDFHRQNFAEPGLWV